MCALSRTEVQSFVSHSPSFFTSTTLPPCARRQLNPCAVSLRAPVACTRGGTDTTAKICTEGPHARHACCWSVCVGVVPSVSQASKRTQASESQALTTPPLLPRAMLPY